MGGFDVVRPPMREITDSDRCSLLRRPLACSTGTSHASRGVNTVCSMVLAPRTTGEERSKSWRSWQRAVGWTEAAEE